MEAKKELNVKMSYSRTEKSKIIEDLINDCLFGLYWK